ENVGWINVGNGVPTGGLYYGNLNGIDFGVNVNPDGSLSGLGWGENVGWVNFGGGALASPAQPAMITCDGRLHGYVWGENLGWLNLDDASRFVSLAPSAVPVTCDLNHDGQVDGLDVQEFVNHLVAGDASWAELCGGDLDHDGLITAADVQAFAHCLLQP